MPRPKLAPMLHRWNAFENACNELLRQPVENDANTLYKLVELIAATTGRGHQLEGSPFIEKLSNEAYAEFKRHYQLELAACGFSESAIIGLSS